MKEEFFQKSLERLIDYVERENLKGYDPYDTLNSWFPFKLFGKWGPPVGIQFGKKNPFNIRPLMGIKKGINPKGMGLFLKAYSIMYRLTGEKRYRDKASEIFNWLSENSSEGYSGFCWGYNFDWASPGSYHKAYTPSAVVTAFVVDGIFEYLKVFADRDAEEIIHSAAKYTDNDLPVSEFETGLSIAYTPASKGACYNASLLGVETLVKSANLSHNPAYMTKCKSAVEFVLSKQKEDGSWNYSFNPDNDSERVQIDFHQGYVLQSLYRYMKISGDDNPAIDKAIKDGLDFYFKNQFFENGRAKWRLPKLYPADIHNQTQGIITFSEMSEYSKEYLPFAETIAKWTIENMQDKTGYFYYQKFSGFTNKIPYIRWSQAWMLLALTTFLESKEEN